MRSYICSIRKRKGAVFIHSRHKDLRKSQWKRARQPRAHFVLTLLVPVSATPRAWLRAHSQQQCWTPPRENKEGRELLHPGSLSRLPSPSSKACPGVGLEISPTVRGADKHLGVGELLLTVHLETNGNVQQEPDGVGRLHGKGLSLKPDSEQSALSVLK